MYHLENHKLTQSQVQRNLTYSTQDVRDAYAEVKRALREKQDGTNIDTYSKVVFILHSQGGIEGGLVIDWLLDELPQDTMNKLEIYTFGCAANHFNNPHRSQHDADTARWAGSQPINSKAIRHIEHYANHGDFVSQFGVMNYIDIPDRFIGRLFVAPWGGHLLNQHYLHEMFPLDPETNRVLEKNAFMDSEVNVRVSSARNEQLTDLQSSLNSTSGLNEQEIITIVDANSPVSPISVRKPTSPILEEQEEHTLKVSDFSRLWCYRDGKSPPDANKSMTWPLNNGIVSH